MNNPNPLVPQGSLQSKGKSTVRIAVFTIAAIHIVFIGGFLIQGCKKSDDKPIVPIEEDTNALSLPPMTSEQSPLDESNYAPVPDTTVSTPVQPVQPELTPVVPVVPDESREYVVLKGDTFSGIAKKTGVSSKAIQDANPGVDPTRLQIGQKLHVPAAGSFAPSNVSNGTSDSADASTYTVKSGDMLEKIARRNGTSVKAIMTLNNLKTTKIRIGQKIKLPANKAAETTESSNYVTPLPTAP